MNWLKKLSKNATFADKPKLCKGQVCVISCNLMFPVDCEQSEWRPERGCTVACGGGEQQLARTVLLQPQLGGQPCGPGNKTMPCNEQACGDDSFDCYPLFREVDS